MDSAVVGNSELDALLGRSGGPEAVATTQASTCNLTVTNESVLFTTADGEIHLGVGAPDRSLLKISANVLAKAASDALGAEDAWCLLQYGPTKGLGRFRRSLAQFLSVEYGRNVESERLMLTSGATAGLSLVLQMYARTGATVFVENATYFLAINVFRDVGLNIVPVESDAEGMRIDCLASAVQDARAQGDAFTHANFGISALVYLVPTFGNPTGRTLSIERRQQLVSLAREHSLLIVCDDVYECLGFDSSETDETHRKSVPPTLVSYDTAGRHVVSNCSFSKLFGPGLRLGWIEAGRAILDVLSDSGFAASGGSANHAMSGMMACALENGSARSLLSLQRKTYARRCETLCSVLEQNLPPLASFLRPRGGFFVWIRLPSGCDASSLLTIAREQFGVAFQPGNRFSVARTHSDYIRLSFAYYDDESLTIGATKLCDAIRYMLGQKNSIQ